MSYYGFSGVMDDSTVVNANQALAAANSNPGFMAQLSDGSSYAFSMYNNLVNHLAAVQQGRPDTVDASGNLSDLFRQALSQYTTEVRRLINSAPAPAPVTDRSAQVAIVTQGYRQYLNREPDADGLNFWVNELATGRKTQADLVNAFLVSGEYLAAHPIAGATPPSGVAGAGDLTPGAAAPAGGSNLMLYAGIAIAAYFLLK